MKRLSAVCLAALILSAAIPASSAVGEDAGLSLSCASSVLMEKETGTILYDQDSHAKLEPASVTKVMTLLLVMEAVDSGRLSPEDMVTVSAHAAGMGGSQVYLKEGEQMSVSEMIKCVTVVSGNDCAVALAEHLAGSETAFVSQMNQRARELGMADTNFVNCTGLPAQGHLTSAYDIALMSRELILNHPNIRQYTTIWMDSIRDGAFGLTNTNRLVRFYQGTTGLKTGSTDGAGFCISATAERDGMELIAVIMRSPTGPERFEDAKALLDYGFANYALVNAYPDAPLAPVDVLLGTVSQVQPQLQRECRLLVRKGQEDQVSTKLTLAEDLEAPVEQGQTLGQLEVYVGEELRDTVPIVSAQQVDRLTVPGIFTRMLRQLLMAG
ncbi:D-alanyl-D-alanine carboxypeptidase family protein [Pseudoflavonifractor phocaeensis]|uniref:D-alanyl-D-alanine carboxypeptidase family protein n=1 Tax=Pseudoflavonifractor phocaeensis TaxID=1870988 RepID=UPI001F44B360|nr:D-alanyl-D-alanine carboxypeptidase family protein [Pseudoflavonifractor phocaeensis]MCF2661491.1 D-alanyl-D-alanine carboxypeptidase [Pseudoflavonifractor phocaeensis]